MKHIGVAVITLVALALPATALAAYSSATLSVSYAPGGVTRIVAASDVKDDATARAAIVVGSGTVLSTGAAPGTKVGTVKAQVSALALGGALLPLAGDIIVAPAGAVPAASQTACIGALPVITTYLLVLQAAGQTINLPAYLVPVEATLASIGTTELVFCLAPPDLPTTSGGATFGAKFMSADMSFTGVFSPLGTAAWVGLWTPWQAGNGQTNPAGTVASVSLILPGLVTLKGKRVNGRVTLQGTASQSGLAAPVRVSVWGAVGKATLRPLKSVVTNSAGVYKLTLLKSAKQTVFQSRVTETELVSQRRPREGFLHSRLLEHPGPLLERDDQWVHGQVEARDRSLSPVVRCRRGAARRPFGFLTISPHLPSTLPTRFATR